MSLDHMKVKTTDEYETQTDNSNSPSENKTDKIYEHKTCQYRVENLDAFTTTTEIKRFLIVLKTINRSEWASPMFTVSKTYQTPRSITDLKEVNKKIVTKRIQS
jgi:hypothetical protein